MTFEELSRKLKLGHHQDGNLFFIICNDERFKDGGDVYYYNNGDVVWQGIFCVNQTPQEFYNEWVKKAEDIY